MQKRRIIDVRQPAEFAAGSIEGAELVPLGQLSRACEEWDRQEPITLVCRSGHRARMAHGQLRARGFADVTVLEGGIQRWRAEGKPLQATAAAGGAGRIVRWALQIAVVVAALVLARMVSPWFLAIPALMAARWIFIRG